VNHGVQPVLRHSPSANVSLASPRRGEDSDAGSPETLERVVADNED